MFGVSQKSEEMEENTEQARLADAGGMEDVYSTGKRRKITCLLEALRIVVRGKL